MFLPSSLRRSLTITLSSIREQMFRLFTARINAMFDHSTLSSIVENKCFVFLQRAWKQCLITRLRSIMFRLFTTRIKARYVVLDNKCFVFLRRALMQSLTILHYLVLENKCFVFLRRALTQCLIGTLSYIRQQMFRLFTTRINSNVW